MGFRSDAAGVGPGCSGAYGVCLRRGPDRDDKADLDEQWDQRARVLPESLPDDQGHGSTWSAAEGTGVRSCKHTTKGTRRVYEMGLGSRGCFGYHRKT